MAHQTDCRQVPGEAGTHLSSLARCVVSAARHGQGHGREWCNQTTSQPQESAGARAGGQPPVPFRTTSAFWGPAARVSRSLGPRCQAHALVLGPLHSSHTTARPPMPLSKRLSLRKVSSEGGTERRHPNRTGGSPRVAWECWPGFTRATTGGEQPKAGQCSGHTFLNPVTQGPKQAGFRPPPSLKCPAPRPRPARSSGRSRPAVWADGPAGTHMPRITNKRPLQRWRTDTKRPCIQIRQLEQAVDGTGRAGWEVWPCAGDTEAQWRLCPARRHHRFSFSRAPFTKTPEPSKRLPCKGREGQRASDVNLFCRVIAARKA